MSSRLAEQKRRTANPSADAAPVPPVQKKLSIVYFFRKEQVEFVADDIGASLGSGVGGQVEEADDMLFDLPQPADLVLRAGRQVLQLQVSDSDEEMAETQFHDEDDKFERGRVSEVEVEEDNEEDNKLQISDHDIDELNRMSDSEDELRKPSLQVRHANWRQVHTRLVEDDEFDFPESNELIPPEDDSDLLDEDELNPAELSGEEDASSSESESEIEDDGHVDQVELPPKRNRGKKTRKPIDLPVRVWTPRSTKGVWRRIEKLPRQVQDELRAKFKYQTMIPPSTKKQWGAWTDPINVEFHFGQCIAHGIKFRSGQLHPENHEACQWCRDRGLVCTVLHEGLEGHSPFVGILPQPASSREGMDRGEIEFWVQSSEDS